MNTPPRTDNCPHTLLAHSAVGHVSICPECEVVQLVLQSLTVRLDLTVLAALTEMLLQARQTLQGAQPCESLHETAHAILH